jgi:hypothetical protein
MARQLAEVAARIGVSLVNRVNLMAGLLDRL